MSLRRSLIERDPMPETAERFDPNDSRFFVGHTWVSDDEDCRLGLSMSGEDREAACRKFLSPQAQYHHNRGRTFTLYTMQRPDDTPTRHEITL